MIKVTTGISVAAFFILFMVFLNFMHTFSTQLNHEKEMRLSMNGKIESLKMAREKLSLELNELKQQLADKETAIDDLKKRDGISISPDRDRDRDRERDRERERELEYKIESYERSLEKSSSSSSSVSPFGNGDNPGDLFSTLAEVQRITRIVQIGQHSSEYEYKRLKTESGGSVQTNLHLEKISSALADLERASTSGDKDLINGAVEKLNLIKSSLLAVTSQSNQPNVGDFGSYLYNMNRMIMDRLDAIRSTELMSNYISELSNKVKKEAKRRINALQFPEDCNKAKFLYCNINKGCGFGCQIHHAAFCFTVAYGANRTLMLDAGSWSYTHQGWDSVFKPVSGCPLLPHMRGNRWTPEADARGDQYVVSEIAEMMENPKPPFVPNAMPDDLHEYLSRYHSNPPVWWVGQLLTHMLRPNEATEGYLQEHKESLGWGHPIVGFHVRRTDKLYGEAQFHSIEEYMKHAIFYYEEYERKNGRVEQKRIFLATDDASVLPEAIQKYPGYVFLSDAGVSKLASAQSSRYSHDSLKGVLLDVFHLADTNYLVCTFSSQICRLAYELMQDKHVDASFKFTSLDDPWYFGGGQWEYVKAIEPHDNPLPGQIKLQVGDVIQNHARYDGWNWKGKNMRTGETGLYPGYKAEPHQRENIFPKWN